MKKKIYVAPNIKVRSVDTTSLLAASTINTGISDTAATGGGRAKGGIFSSEEAGGGGMWNE